MPNQFCIFNPSKATLPTNAYFFESRLYNTDFLLIQKLSGNNIISNRMNITLTDHETGVDQTKTLQQWVEDGSFIAYLDESNTFVDSYQLSARIGGDAWTYDYIIIGYFEEFNAQVIGT